MDHDVVILPSFAQVEGWCKQHADACASGLFAQTITTFDAWIADLWELHGDGRAIASAMQRQVLMRHVLQDAGDGLELPGVVPLAAECMREAAGVPAFENALALVRDGGIPDGLSPREAAFLAALGRYANLLAELGLVEFGSAVASLAVDADNVFSRETRVLMAEARPLTWIQQHFFSSCNQVSLTVGLAAGVGGVGRAPEGVNVQFAFPSGSMAEPALVADIVLENPGSGDVVVVCKDPIGLCGRIEERLAAEGLDVCVQASKPFGQTDFGRAFLALCRCLHEDPWDAAALSDVLVSPFAGLSQADAFTVDKALRADRLVSREDAFTSLRASSELFSQLEEIASDPEADVLIGVFEQMTQASAGRSATWRAEQLAAMGALREATAAARRVNGDIESCSSVLQRATVQVSSRVEAEGPRVLFTTQSQAARLNPRCCEMLVVADLTSGDYPVADKDDAASTLLSKLSLDPEESALSRARREFCAVLGLATKELRVVRPLGDASAEATYPSVVLEEFIDSYRSDPAATDDIDNAYRLPLDMQSGMIERGEELLFANGRGSAADVEQPIAAEMLRPRMEDSGDKLESSDWSPRYLSPSQVETYLECPYQWFATRRLRIDALDEGFGPLERGTFAHEALDTFYRRFQESGHMKVTIENLGEAKELMRQVLSEVRESQHLEEPRSGRLVPVTELERREVDSLCEQLVSYLDFEAELLPTFHPAYFEYTIEADQAIDYAGVPLVGRVDRIDMDDKSHAVIIDYKGSLNAEHEIGGKTAEHAGKVQTRIYARAIEQALGVQVVGALYVSYGRRPAVVGAYDPRVLEAAHLPGMRHDRCSCGLLELTSEQESGDTEYSDLAFDVMLDETEKLVVQAVGAMSAGAVEPNPSNSRVCSYCPVLACPKRGA